MSSVPKPISIDCKFSALAIVNVRAKLEDGGAFLPDGTQILTGFPFELEAHWGKWLGSTVIESRKDCNLVFLRTATDGWTSESLPVVDDVNARLPNPVTSGLPVIGERRNKTFPSGELWTASLNCGKSRLSCATLNYESNASVPCA
jgi:hypothetical protein